MPTCACGDEYPQRRHDLGYRTCLGCGSPRQEFLIMDVPKSNSIVTSNPKNLIGLARSHKGTATA